MAGCFTATALARKQVYSGGGLTRTLLAATRIGRVKYIIGGVEKHTNALQAVCCWLYRVHYSNCLLPHCVFLCAFGVQQTILGA